jgi:hypothetical protein
MSYNPNQPMVPAGKSGGGQWTSDGSGAADAARDAIRDDRMGAYMDRLDRDDRNLVDDSVNRYINRPGNSPPVGHGTENEKVLMSIRQDDLVDFGSYGKYYVQGWNERYFMVTKKQSERFVEDPIHWNLQGAISLGDAKRVIRPGYY